MQLCSCAGTIHSPGRSSDSTASAPIEKPAPDQPPPQTSREADFDDTQARPRAIASLELTTQGRNLLTQGRPDAAIRLLERALQLNPTNGQNYYYLAEAWIMKKNLSQAREYNDLAQIYFVADPLWQKRAESQRKRFGAEDRE